MVSPSGEGGEYEGLWTGEGVAQFKLDTWQPTAPAPSSLAYRICICSTPFLGFGIFRVSLPPSGSRIESEWHDGFNSNPMASPNPRGPTSAPHGGDVCCSANYSVVICNNIFDIRTPLNCVPVAIRCKMGLRIPRLLQEHTCRSAVSLAEECIIIIVKLPNFLLVIFVSTFYCFFIYWSFVNNF